MQSKMMSGAVLLAVLLGCDGDRNVEVLPLPSLERPSPEALMGLPEVAGQWRFAGWEVDSADSTALAGTFPSFGDLVIATQRLDSIAGTFELGGRPVPVVGEVRKEGTLALVTYIDRVPGSFIAGDLARDTLWLELTSVMPRDEWPRDSRAAFIRGPVNRPIAWLRGANPAYLPPPLPTDSLTAPAGPVDGGGAGRGAAPGATIETAPSRGGVSADGGSRPRAPEPRNSPASPRRSPPLGTPTREPATPSAEDQPSPTPSRPEPEEVEERQEPPAQQAPRPPVLLGEPVVPGQP